MGESTKIAWTDHTFNPWWGCQRVSPGCEHCYAETFAKRVGLKVWGPQSDRRFFGEKHWAEPLKWNRAAERDGVRRRVFCASMADVFEERGDLVEHRARLVRLIEATPHLDWLLLTKRPENMLQLGLEAGLDPEGWLSNIWAGTTCEDQQRADERLPHLLAVPAVVRFVSYEPALGPVDFFKCWTCDGTGVSKGWTMSCPDCDRTGRSSDWRSRRGVTGAPYPALDWVIVGGESGPGARPFDLAWAASVVHGCRTAGVACFFKQAGRVPFDSREPDRDSEPHPDGPAHDLSCRLDLIDPKGGDPSEWPEDLRVREWPSRGTRGRVEVRHA